MADPRFNAVVLGPGLGVGAETRARLSACAGPGRRLVVDADAVTSFAGAPGDLRDILARADAAVLTPHDGEFARLFGHVPGIMDAASKLERARAAAAHLGAVMVLKGPDTVVAAPDGRASIADNAPPFLATAGAGDVLAGMTCGFLAQGMPAFEAASAAVWLHGEAAREAGPGLVADDLPGPGLVADDLPEALRPVLARLHQRLTDQA
ncbi:MAG: hypothetical protein B7Z30_15085 [Rhizobiales bacterium 12-68-15]|nr:MAG: hypothetical protein B7Z30_15085 [Rhizobiales bacterium 12-68-15]